MTKLFTSPILLPALLLLSGLSGCGGGGGSPSGKLSLSGRNANGLSISLSQQSASIASGQGNRYTLTVRNDTSQARGYLLIEYAGGDSPGYFTLSDPGGRSAYESVDFAKDVVKQVDLEPKQSVTRTFAVPASAFASRGTYQVDASFFNNAVLGDGPTDDLGPLEVVVR